MVCPGARAIKNKQTQGQHGEETTRDDRYGLVSSLKVPHTHEQI